MKKITTQILLPVAVGVAITLIVQRINGGAPKPSAQADINYEQV